MSVVNEIRSQVRNGNRRPGARLLPCRELAVHMGCHYHTARKALKILEREGYVEFKCGSGIYVTHPVFASN